MDKEQVDRLATEIRSLDRSQLEKLVHDRHSKVWGVKSADVMMDAATLELRHAALVWRSHDGLDASDAAGRTAINKDVRDAGYTYPYAPGIKPDQRRQHPLYVEGDDV